MKAVLLGTGSPPPNPRRRGPSTLLSLGQAARFLLSGGRQIERVLPEFQPAGSQPAAGR
jgi:ribonuclease BN (tRNA processing enzyme)